MAHMRRPAPVRFFGIAGVVAAAREIIGACADSTRVIGFSSLPHTASKLPAAIFTLDSRPNIGIRWSDQVGRTMLV